MVKMNPVWEVEEKYFSKNINILFPIELQGVFLMHYFALSCCFPILTEVLLKKRVILFTLSVFCDYILCKIYSHY